MLQAPSIDTAAPDTVTLSRADFERFERLQGELKFAQTKIAALNFELVRLKRWRFGSSSESLDAQAPLFEAIVADTTIEDAAAREERLPTSGAGQARRPRATSTTATLRSTTTRWKIRSDLSISVGATGCSSARSARANARPTS